MVEIPNTNNHLIYDENNKILRSQPPVQLLLSQVKELSKEVKLPMTCEMVSCSREQE